MLKTECVGRWLSQGKQDDVDEKDGQFRVTLGSPQVRNRASANHHGKMSETLRLFLFSVGG